MTTARFETTQGTVTGFDDARGLGTVTAADGRTFPFHCTSIADGSRSIVEGTAVRFTVAAGPGGRFEAADLTPG